MHKIKKSLKNFNRWMSYNPPGALTVRGWRLFNEEFKEKAPIRFWFKNSFRRKFILPIIWKYNSISHWFRYRTYDRYHIVNTGLSPDYYDKDTIILHSNFNILKDFVEVELAWTHYIWLGERKNSFYEKYIPFYRIFRPFRNRQWGLDYLQWASTLDDPSILPNLRCERQAVESREILELYLWWTQTRPNRKEYDYPVYSDQGLGIMSSLDDDFDDTADDYKNYKEIYNKNIALQEQWDNEDTDMLIRLMKIRKALWT